MSSPIIEEGIRSHLRGRNRFLNVMTHDVVERLRIRRKALADDAGLDNSYDVGTYPPDLTTVVMPSNGLARLGLGALAGGLGSLGVAAALGAFHVSPQSPATSVPDPHAQEWEITIQSVDGKPTVTSAEVVE